MFVVAMVAILATMALALTRVVLGPTVYDRILAVNMAGTKTILLIAVIGFLTGRPDFLDLALIYVVLGFVITIAVLKFVEYGNFAATGEKDRKAEA
jgi:multicomponent Na+:H+ antiporter subunit F